MFTKLSLCVFVACFVVIRTEFTQTSIGTLNISVTSDLSDVTDNEPQTSLIKPEITSERPETTSEEVYKTSETENLEFISEELKETSENLETTSEETQTSEDIEIISEEPDRTSPNLEISEEPEKTSENLETISEQTKTSENFEITSEESKTSEDLEVISEEPEKTSENLETTSEQTKTSQNEELYRTSKNLEITPKEPKTSKNQETTKLSEKDGQSKMDQSERKIKTKFNLIPDDALQSDINLSQSPDNDLSPNYNPPTSTSKIPEETIEINENTLQSSEDLFQTHCSTCQNFTFSNLQHTIKDNEVQVTWDNIKQENINCNYNFDKQIREIDYIRHENFTGANISTRNLCGTSLLKLTAINLCGQEFTRNLTLFIEANNFEIIPFNITAFTSLIAINSTNCPLDDFYVNCSKMFENSFEVLNFEGQVLKDNGYLLEGFLPYSNYSCRGYLYYQDAVVGESDFIVETLETAPTQVRNLKVSNMKSLKDGGLEISWDSPENINGVLRGYEIRIEASPLFDAPRFCKLGTTEYTISVGKDVQNCKFDDLRGNYEYKIGIRAQTNEFGPMETVSTETSGNSTEIENLNYYIDTPQLNSPMVHLTWTYPCKTYTAIENILFNIHILEEGKTTEIVNKTVTEEDFLENLTIDIPLTPSTNNTIVIYVLNIYTNMKSHGESISFQSPRGNTTTPKLTLEPTHDLVIVKWDQPDQIYGELLYYQVNVTLLDYLHKVNCKEDLEFVSVQLKETKYYYFARPHRKYQITITAVTTQGDGIPLTEHCATRSAPSKPPRNLTCDVLYPPGSQSVIIRYHEPCDFNGIFDSYIISLIDEQGNEYDEIYERDLSHIVRRLKPDMTYIANVTTLTVGNQDNGETYTGKEAICEFKTFAGIPDPPVLKEDKVIIKVYDKQVEVLLRNDYFQDDQGEVKYFALLVGIASKWDDGLVEGDWNGLNWPNNEFWNTEGVTYQATPAHWEPLKGSTSWIVYTLGRDNCTDVVNSFCNGPLLPETDYYLSIRGYTNNGYQISNKLSFRTVEDYTKSKNVVLIIGIVAGMLVMVIVTAIGCLYWKRRPPKPTTIEEANQIVSNAEQVVMFPFPVRIDEFPAFYNERKGLLSEEFESLGKIGIELEKNDGALPENRKKNRYINILPYDCSRVHLQASKTDYINASYIKGYSSEVEYIATQGPLESTAADFWLMVMAENCSVVAMVAQFEEQKKSKCYRYFPERREQMELELDDGTELMVRCSYELNFDFYIERQILVQAHDKQLTVTHLQFLNWPDFGCPEGTTNMLQFTKRLRRHMEKNDSIAVIHCSAGVGRTGTLVAVDILLQTIRDGRDINIYGTVAELRKQRTRMVQAEMQYFYVYKCILDEILQPVELTEIKPIDPIYENLENIIEMKVFSKDNNNCEECLKETNELEDKTSEETIDNKQNQINSLKNEETKSEEETKPNPED